MEFFSAEVAEPDTALLAMMHAIVSAKAKCYFSDAKSMKAKETQEPPEHPLELTKASIQAPTTTDSLMVSGCAMYLSASRDTQGILETSELSRIKKEKRVK
jgi:hypothetical protein